eukprot:TRINITY_DN3861_c0_g1_i8.p1 TRINITY_DN3861_c0_g1~~TRINITY_DN3861_c0_g1_i8.p1  ORF type:complete len:457 (-),score=17.11 TRINITY_DN3861_c0_g1_i8:764-2134(-)
MAILTAFWPQGTIRTWLFRDQMKCHDPQQLWPVLVEYFYTGKIEITDDNVQALLSLSRELIVQEVENFCFEYVKQQLGPDNVILYLQDAIRYHHEQLSAQCVKLSAELLPQLWNQLPTYLPSNIILQILRHPNVNVQCELQVLELIRRFIDANDDSLTKRQKQDLIKEVRVPYLPNDEITEIYNLKYLPKDWFIAGVMQRLRLLQKPERIQAATIQPRQSYCCICEQQVPGSSTYAEIPLEVVWEDLKAEILKQNGVHVNSQYEGEPQMVLSNDKNQYFYAVTTNRVCACVDIIFPPSVEVSQLDQYSFGNGSNPVSVVFPYGIVDLGYQSKTDWITEVGQDIDGPFTELKHVEMQHVNMENVVVLDKDQAASVHPWRVLRLRLTNSSESGEYLSVKDLKVWGILKVQLIGDPFSQQLLQRIQRKKQSATPDLYFRRMSFQRSYIQSRQSSQQSIF